MNDSYKIQTSYFAKSSLVENPISIANSAPKFFKGEVFKEFVPPWKLVNDYKEHKITEDQYTESYLKLLDGLSDDVLIKIPHIVTFCCWEAPNKFCHRHILAKWLEEKLHLKITEVEF